jgi:CRP/FNR family transcriptional regulator, cyclic AMP receptor protein
LSLGAKQGQAVTAKEHLAQIAACFRCPDHEAKLICAVTNYREFAHRSPVARRGDVSAHLYLVVDGVASADLYSIDGQHAQLAGYGPGELFGAYPEPTTHRADVSAIGNLSVLAIDTRAIAELAAQHAAISQGIAHLMARQLDMVLDRMAARIGLTATGRCYRALLGKADDAGWIRPLPILSALAISVNTTRETASRALAHLVRRGIVERHDDGLKIVSRRMLEELVV